MPGTETVGRLLTRVFGALVLPLTADPDQLDRMLLNLLQRGQVHPGGRHGDGDRPHGW